MSVGKQGSAQVTITFDDINGTPRSIGNGVLTISGVKITAAMQLTHAFGDAWEESSPTGMRKLDPITMTGFFDDTPTTGTHVVMQVRDGDVDPNGNSRTLTIVFGPNSGDTAAGETRLVSYEALGKNGNLTDFQAVVQPTGAWTWA